MTIGVSPHYYTITHRVVSRLKESGLEKLARNTEIPIDKLKEFCEKKELPGEYMPTLYSHLFGTMTFLEATVTLDKQGW